MNILFPIETLSREFDYKLILAHRLASQFPQVKIFLGSVPSIHRHVNSFKHGIYFGKTIFPSVSQKINQTWIKRFKANGFDIVYLHEEGAVWFGDEEQWSKNMAFQYDIGLLNKDDVLCVWGETQKKLESKRNHGEVPIEVTGTPRFELGKHYSFLYKKEVEVLKNTYGNFILINGNFGASNHGDGFNKMFSYLKQNEKSYRDNLDYYMNRYISSNTRMLRMCQLTLLAAEKFPDVRFMYRPHPSEDLERYHDIFRGVDNIVIERRGAVLEYILASKGMIHDGCTTSLDAIGSGIPILNFKIVNDDFDIYLPNQIGKTVTNIDNALDEIDLMLNGTFDLNIDNYMPRALNLLYNLGSDDSFEQCVAILKKKISEKLKRQSVADTSPSLRLMRRDSMIRSKKIGLAILKNKMLNNKEKFRRDIYLMNKFGRISKDDLTFKMSLLNEYHRCEINEHYLTHELIFVQAQGKS